MSARSATTCIGRAGELVVVTSGDGRREAAILFFGTPAIKVAADACNIVLQGDQALREYFRYECFLVTLRKARNRVSRNVLCDVSHVTMWKTSQSRGLPDTD